MTHADDEGYYRARAMTESRLAEMTINPIAAGIHRVLAEAYASRARDASAPDVHPTNIFEPNVAGVEQCRPNHDRRFYRGTRP